MEDNNIALGTPTIPAAKKGGCKSGGCNKLSTHDWLDNFPQPENLDFNIVEVRFKNTRKGFYSNINNLPLSQGDIVAVEAQLGHDIGEVSLKGELVREQMKKMGVDLHQEFKKIYRKGKPSDLEKWEKAQGMEQNIMLKARLIVQELKLNMKIGDVEYQGDATKAIFYYIADERVDFRELIKILADEFRVRIEMRQIGARQEAGRIGGIGSCGRELCCSTWMTSFATVSTNAARFQELSLNPQKLAGQCGKLKCCLNFELQNYMEVQKDLPDTKEPLKIAKALFYFQKLDTLKQIMYYSQEKDTQAAWIALPIARVKEIIAMNMAGIPVDNIVFANEKDTHANNDILKDSMSRFENKPNPPRNNPPQRNDRQNAPQQQNQAIDQSPRNPAQRNDQRRPPNQPNQPNQRNPQQRPQNLENTNNPNNTAREPRDNRGQQNTPRNPQNRNDQAQQPNRHRPPNHRPDQQRPQNRNNQNLENKDAENKEAEKE